MFKKKYLFILMILLNLKCFSLEFSREDCDALESFFRIMLKDSEGGYVFYGKKPVCIHGFDKKDYFLCENETHKTSTYIREGMRVWNKLALGLRDQAIIIHSYDGADSLVKHCIHTLFINRDLFLKTVQENLSLFQYVLGPDVTPLKLLNKLTDPKERFHAVLKDDKVLIGILLGFGAQNSLRYSRFEGVEKDFFALEQVPFKNQSSKFGSLQQERKAFLLLANSNSSNLSFSQPSFGYKSLEEEATSLMQNMVISSEKLANNDPSFIFARLLEDEETERLINELEETQDEINKLLLSKKFLEDILLFFSPQEKIILTSLASPKQLAIDPEDSKSLPFLVAANIWTMIEEEKKPYQKAFIEGMREADLTIRKDLNVNTFNYAKLKVLSQITENLKIANQYFNQLDADKDQYACLLPFKLYCKVIKEGSGALLDKQTRVRVHYTLKTPNDQVLADTWMSGQPVRLDLSDTITGFAYGMRGMKSGELREIFIHPALGYGIYTTLDKGIYLKAYVQLVDIDQDQPSSKFPDLTILDFTADVPSSVENDYLEQSKEVGYANGYHMWRHYKKAGYYSLSQILDYINQLQLGQLSNEELDTVKSQHVLSRLHWNIYHSDKE